MVSQDDDDDGAFSPGSAADIRSRRQTAPPYRNGSTTPHPLTPYTRSWDDAEQSTMTINPTYGNAPETITVPSHVVSNQRRFDCLFKSLLLLTSNKTPKLRTTGRLWGDHSGPFY